MTRAPVPVILLAAGGSSRLGHPKQLVPIDGRTLLRRAAEEALATACGPLTVVLGASFELLQEELKGLDLELCRNDDWREGMASSLRVGLRSCLDRDPELPRVLLLLCDQPAVDREVLGRLVALHAEGTTVATACAVEGRPGAPAIFEAECFAQLLALRGDEGARKSLRDGEIQVALLDFPAGGIDIDTEADLT